MSEAAAKPGTQAQIAGLGFALILLDPDLAIAELNPAAEDLLGQGARRLVGRPLFEILECEDDRAGALAREGDVQVVARDVALAIGPRSLQVDFTASPLASYPGWRVITLSEAGREEMEESRGTSTALRAPAVLAHEIKNPLAAIRGAGQLLARRVEGSDKALAQVILDEVDRIAELLDRMQRLGSTTPEPAVAFNLHEGVRNALATVRAAGIADVTLVEAFDPSLPLVLGNRSALEQVIINLVSNACEACADRDGAAVTVKTRFASGAILHAMRRGAAVPLPIELTVSDNGPGIDPDLRDHAFEPFVSSKPGGQGLGLALVRKLVSDFNGRVAHERDERAGLTHFRIHLPAVRREEAA